MQRILCRGFGSADMPVPLAEAGRLLRSFGERG
jgi:hypothetical protein